MLALILLACSNSHDFNALAPGAVILGLAGITFHLSQFHMSNLFPRSRGFISSLLVAGFTGCGAVFYFLDLIFIAAGSTRWLSSSHHKTSKLVAKCRLCGCCLYAAIASKLNLNQNWTM